MNLRGDASWALVLEPGSPRPIAEISQVLVGRLGLHPADAAARVRYSGGILLFEVGLEDAEDLVALLAKAGVAARRVGSALLRGLPRGCRARSLDFLSEAACAGLPSGAELVIFREDLLGVHLYAIPARVAPASGTAPGQPDPGERSLLSPRGAKLREALIAEGNPSISLTLFTREDIGPVRLSREEIDYSSLGKRKMVHSLDNFLLLLEDLLAFAPEVWMGDRIARFLQDLDIRVLLYTKPEEGQNFERWMQLWIRLEAEGKA